MNKSYSELIKLDNFESRYWYLRLYGKVGDLTFGANRYLNQFVYSSQEWKDIRQEVIARDGGWDLGVEGIYIQGHPIVHHINPITKEHILDRHPCVFDLNNLITNSPKTHKAIHYGGFNPEPIIATRTKNDTSPWLR